MKSWTVLALGGLVAFAAVAAVGDALPGPVTAAFSGLVVVGGGVVSRWLAVRQRRLAAQISRTA